MSGDSEKVVGLSYYNKGYESEKIHDQGNLNKNTDNLSEESANANALGRAQEEAVIPTPTTENGTTCHTNNADDDGNIKEKESKYYEEDDIPEGGWGWIVAMGSFIGQMMINILLACYSILYSKFLLDLGTSAVVIAWIFNLMGFMMTLSGMFLRALVVEFGFRKTAYLGTILIFIGTMSTAFATSQWFLMFFYSFVAGMGNGILATLTYSIVPYYFKSRLGLANAIMSSGVSAGQFVGPPLITFLQNQYGFKGAILVLSAILLNCGVGAAVFHPREWHGKRPRILPPKSQNAPRGLELAFRILKTTVANLRLLKSPKAVIIAVGGMLNAIGYLNFLMLVPFAMQELGFSIEEAANSVALSGITNLAMRLIISVMADFPWFNMRLCYMAGTLIVVVLSIGYCFLTDLTTMAVVMGFWGCGVGMYMGLFNLVMVKYMGVENLMAQLGVTSFVSSLWFLSSGPIFGVIRDATGSYKTSIITLASTIAVTLVLYLFLPTAVSYEQRREERLKLKKNGP